MANRQVPIDPLNPGGSPGTITFYPNTPAEPAGVFAFSYYNRGGDKLFANRNIREGAAKESNVYIQGLLTYLELTELDGPFRGWKVVIYIDEVTKFYLDLYKGYGYEHIIRLLAHPNLIVALCDWPEYTINPYKYEGRSYTKIDNILLRTLRFHAFLDFFGVPVLVRDADTYFETQMVEIPQLVAKENANPRPLKSFREYLSDWEGALFEHHMRSGLPFLLSAHPGYMQDWHANDKVGMHTFGHLAGLVNCMPGLAEWHPENPANLWNLSLTWLRDRYKIRLYYGKYQALSNLQRDTYIGKDEQIISFVWLEYLFPKCFFFYFHIQNTESLNQMKRAKSAKNDHGVSIYYDMFMRFQGGFLEAHTNRLWTPHQKLLHFKDCETEAACKGVFDTMVAEQYFPDDTVFERDIQPYLKDKYLFNHLNVFNVVEAFRDTFYFEFLKHILRTFLDMYIAKRDKMIANAAAKAEGGKRRSRKMRKNHSRKTRRTIRSLRKIYT